MTGYYRMFRGWLEHPVLDIEPYCRRSAWAWLIEHAAWRPHIQNVGNHSIAVERGQLATSVRFLAKAWGWDKARVTRMLGRLNTETMIETRAETHGTVITICNYDKFQAETTAPETPAETPTETEARHPRDKEEEGKEREGRNQNIINITDKRPAGSNLPVQSRSALFELWWQRWDIPGTKQGKKTAKRAFDKIMQRREATFDELSEGLARCMAHHASRKTDTQFIKKPAAWLNGGHWSDDYPEAMPATESDLLNSIYADVAEVGQQ